MVNLDEANGSDAEHQQGNHQQVQAGRRQRQRPRRNHREINMSETGKDFLRILIAIILPPLGVFLQVGLGLHFWLNIVLTLFGYVPGIIHAIYIIISRGPR